MPILVFWTPDDSASGLVIAYVQYLGSCDMHMRSRLVNLKNTADICVLMFPVFHAGARVLCFLQMKSMNISEALLLSTSAFLISTPGLCSYLQSWACSLPASQVGLNHVSIPMYTMCVCDSAGNDGFRVSPRHT